MQTKDLEGIVSIKFRRILLLAGITGVILVASLYAFLKIDPVSYRTYVFQPVREISFFIRELDALTNPAGIQKTVIPEPETVVIPASAPSGVDITAGIYRPVSSTAAPALILLHGSYPWGRKAGLVRMLAKRLADNGYFVIVPDARGFGDTADPATIDDPESWRTASDLSQVVDYLSQEVMVDSNSIYVLGHSMGANHALEGGLPDSRIKALILVGPGRFTQQEDFAVPDWERARFSADRRLQRPVSSEVAQFAYSLGNIRLLAKTELSKPNHKPILLIDGEKEGEAKLAYLAAIVSVLKGPIEYRTLPGTGHYCGVRSFYGSEMIYYRSEMFAPFLEMVLKFLNRQHATSDTVESEMSGR